MSPVELRAADPTRAVAALLKSDPVINALTEGRVYRPEIPTENEAAMPTGTVVITPSGGGQLTGRDRLPIKDSRVDVVCYGETRLEAEDLARECERVMAAVKRSKWAGVVIRWIRIAGGPVSAVDPNTSWPMCVVVGQVLHNSET